MQSNYTIKKHPPSERFSDYCGIEIYSTWHTWVLRNRYILCLVVYIWRFRMCYGNAFWTPDPISFVHIDEIPWRHASVSYSGSCLTHWGRVTHICVGNLTIIGRRQAVIWTNVGILLIGISGTNFSEIIIEIQTISLRKIRLKMSSAKYCSFLLGLNVLNNVLLLRASNIYMFFSTNTTIPSVVICSPMYECFWNKINSL